MIFVTVGTDEHPFVRLLEEIENLIKTGIIREDVVVQRGHTEFFSELFNEVYSFLPFDKFLNFMERANLVITHGGPGSIMIALNFGKIPIVVPRRKEFGEHVDNHQVKFAEFLGEKGKIIPVYDVRNLKEIISRYNRGIDDYRVKSENLGENAEKFALKLDKICREVTDEG